MKIFFEHQILTTVIMDWRLIFSLYCIYFSSIVKKAHRKLIERLKFVPGTNQY